MVNVIKSIVGEPYNISVNHKRILKGWYIIITKQGEEYLVQRNLSLSSNVYRNVYQTTFSFKESIIKPKKDKGTYFAILAIFVGGMLARFLRVFLPVDTFFGDINMPVNVWVGISNIWILLLSTVSYLLFLKFYRKKKLEKFLQQHESSLTYVGKIRSKSYFKKLSNGVEVW